MKSGIHKIYEFLEKSMSLNFFIFKNRLMLGALEGILGKNSSTTLLGKMKDFFITRVAFSSVS